MFRPSRPISSQGVSPKQRLQTVAAVRPLSRKNKEVFTEGTRFLMTTTSIDDLQPVAQTALSSSPIFELRDLRVEQHEQTLLLLGAVSSFYHKQLAQEVVRAVCEGIEVTNSIHVK